MILIVLNNQVPYAKLALIEAGRKVLCDFLVFQHNEFLQDANKLKTAGVPDLIVEVWSPFNKPHEREMKFRLYSSHSDCEHWYIEQNNNLVKCFKGKHNLPNQYLSKILKTTTGLTFDLTHMSL